MKKILAFLSFILITGIPTLFGQWELVNPYPTAEDLTSVYFLDSDTGWAVGHRGAVLNTTDGGDHWHLLQYLTLENLHDVYFHDEFHGILLGDHGTLFTTDDGGITWQKQESGTSEDLRDICFSDEDHGWMVGTGGTILRTVNGGMNWLAQSGSPNVALFSAAAIDNEKGWIAGNFAALSTADGGQSWINHHPLYGFFEIYNEFYFSDDRHGWALADVGDLLITSDGGGSWQYSGTPVSLYGNSMFFIDSLQGWIVSGQGRIWHTADGGYSFSLQETPTEADLFAVHFTDQNNGWAAGEGGQIIHTQDGGQSWSAQSHGMPGFFISVCFTDHDYGWIADYSGPIMHTTDGGSNWETQNIGSGEQIRDIYFADRDHGWALGQWSSVSRTTDGGATWLTDTLVGPDHYFVNVFFADVQHGWCSANYFPKGKDDRSAAGILYSTVDGGITWDSTGWGDAYPRDIFFIDQQKGWVCCSDNRIMITDDGGLTWNFHDCGTDLVKVFFLDALSGFALGLPDDPYSCAIFKTTDGGYSWQLAYQRNSCFLESLDFPDALHGWAVGTVNFDDRSIILRTSDGGLTWEEQAFPTRGLWDVDFTDTSNGWAVGRNGTIYHTTNGGPVYIQDEKEDPLREFLSVYPNPARGRVTIEFYSEMNACTEILVSDMMGREVWHSSSYGNHAGRHSVEWKPNTDAGIYLLICKLNNRFITRKILVLD
jgi:photosystem II stability/assembly factor-like uncharacterized protein